MGWLFTCAQYFALQVRAGADHTTHSILFWKPNVDNGQIQLQFLGDILATIALWTIYVIYTPYTGRFQEFGSTPEGSLPLYSVNGPNIVEAHDMKHFPFLEPCDLQCWQGSRLSIRTNPETLPSCDPAFVQFFSGSETLSLSKNMFLEGKTRRKHVKFVCKSRDICTLIMQIISLGLRNGHFRVGLS